MVPFEIQEKNYDLGEQLSESRINMCGIGTRKVKLFLNRKIKQGDTKARILRVALEAEDANISAKQYWGDYKYKYYEKKADKIHDLISLYEKDQTLVFGYQDYKGRETNHIIYFELPDSGEQISFHCTLSKTDDIPVYGKAWDGVQNSTLPQIEKDIELLYGEELRQRYAS